MRSKPCIHCGQPPLYFPDVDTMGCLTCDLWTEQPHACNMLYGGCKDGFKDAPGYPSQYKGKPPEAI